MAKVLLTQKFADLENWPGGLLEAEGGATVLTKTATAMVFQYPSSGSFPGYKVSVTGTGFAYIGNVPIAGKMSALRILNGSGETVLTVTEIGANVLANDLSQFYASVFGSKSASGDGPNPDAISAWSHLLAGNDVITGTSGNDDEVFPGNNAGNDVYRMGAGDDRIGGGIGKDTMHGGDGFDTITFTETTYNAGQSATKGISVNVKAGTLVDVWGYTDTFTSIEMFVGSRFNDKFVGGSDRDRFAGIRGRDSFDGGDNTFNSTGGLTGDKRDTVSYQDDYWNGGRLGIIADLETAFAGGSITGTIRDGFGNTDTVRDIERIDGTRYADVFVGSRVDNVFKGGEGVDRYDGAAGSDALNFSGWFGNTAPTSGVRVDLSKTTGQVMNDGFGNTETAVSMEDVWGSELGDQVKGNAANNFFWMNTGADTMTGGAGSDTFEWGSDQEIGQGDRVTDFTASGTGADKLSFFVDGFDDMTSTVHLVNGTAATVVGQGTFVFNAVNDTLYWDHDGKGGDAMRAVVVLTNVAALSASNFDL